MKRLIARLLLVAAAPLVMGATDLSGEVQASWSEPTRVHVSTDAELRPGHIVTVTVTGQVDINRQEKSERKCAYLIKCEVVRWTQHFWTPPERAPVVIQIRDITSGTPGEVVVQRTVFAAPEPIEIPYDGVNFARKFEVVGLLAGAGERIDPDRSGGAFTVRLSINANRRQELLTRWLANVRPPAKVALSPDVLDAPLLADYARQVATSLRQYAQRNFATDEKSLEQVLRKAVEIAPEDSENLIALAKFFQDRGSPSQADALLQEAITELAGKNDPISKRQLGRAYATRAAVSLSRNGGIDTASAEAAASFLEQAIKAYQEAGRRDLQAQALVTRGRLMRSIRTPAALKVAADSFRSALALAPESAKAAALAPEADGSRYTLLDWSEYSTLEYLEGSGTRPRFDGAVPLLSDSRAGRMLALQNGRTAWIKFETGEVTLAPDLGTGVVDIANGALLTRSGDEYTFTSATGKTSRIVGAADNCTVPPWVDLSSDGRTIAILCGYKLRYLDTSGDTPVQLFERNLTEGALLAPTLLVAGPRNCGVLVARDVNVPGPFGIPYPSRETYDPTIGEPLELYRSDGSPVRLVVPRGPDPAPGVLGGWDLRGGFQADFTSDGNLIVTKPERPGIFAPARPFFAYACSGGALAAAIERPANTTTIDFATLAESLSLGDKFAGLRWLDDRRLVEFDIDGQRIVLLDWQTKQVRIIPMPLNRTVVESRMLMSTLHAAGPDGAAIGYARPGMTLQSRASVEGLPPAVFRSSGATDIELPITSESEVVALDGDRYFLARGKSRVQGASVSRLVDLQSGKSDRPDEVFWAAVSLATPHGWATIDRQIEPKAIQMRSGNALTRVIEMPPASNELRAATQAAITKFETGDWAQMTPERRASWEQESLYRGYPNIPMAQLLAIRSDPSRIGAQYQTLPMLPSLTGTQGMALHSFCAFPTGRTDGGQELPILGTSQIVRVTYPAGSPAFETGPVEGCRAATLLVPGRASALLDVFRMPFGPDGPEPWTEWRWFDGSGWRDLFSGIENVEIVSGWTTAPNEGFVLIKRPQRTYGLYRVTSGAATPACSGCDMLALDEAQEVFTRDDQTVGSERTRVMGGRAMILLDTAGTRIAYPDGEDLVVRSLETDKEVLRVSLGRPVALTTTDLVVDIGKGEMRFHKLQ
jgi:hypothetical protein